MQEMKKANPPDFVLEEFNNLSHFREGRMPTATGLKQVKDASMSLLLLIPTSKSLISSVCLNLFSSTAFICGTGS